MVLRKGREGNSILRDDESAGGRQWSCGREGKGTLSSGMMKAQGGGNGPAEGKGRELYPQG